MHRLCYDVVGVIPAENLKECDWRGPRSLYQCMACKISL